MEHDIELLVKRDLAGLDALMEQMMPAGEFPNVDPKRAAQAATAVGTVILAKQLLGHIRDLISTRQARTNGGHKPGELKALVLSRLNGVPLKKIALVRHCMEKGGYTNPSVYMALKRLEKQGVIKATPEGLVKVK